MDRAAPVSPRVSELSMLSLPWLVCVMMWLCLLKMQRCENTSSTWQDGWCLLHANTQAKYKSEATSSETTQDNTIITPGSLLHTALHTL
jgi:hypothetical protein